MKPRTDSVAAIRRRLTEPPWLRQVALTVLLVAVLAIACTLLILDVGFWDVRNALILLFLGTGIALLFNPPPPKVPAFFVIGTLVGLLGSYFFTPPQPFSIEADGHRFPSLTDWIALNQQLYAEGEEVFRVTVAEESVQTFGDFMLGVPSIKATSLREFGEKLSEVHTCIAPVMVQDHWLVLDLQGEIQVCQAPDGRSFVRCAADDCQLSH